MHCGDTMINGDTVNTPNTKDNWVNIIVKKKHSISMINIQKYHGKCVLNVQKAKHKSNIIYISNNIEEVTCWIQLVVMCRGKKHQK